MLIITAAMIWYAGGLILLLKGGALLRGAYLIDAQSIWVYAAACLGIVAGLVKGRLLFRKSCQKNIQRIKGLAKSRWWQFFQPHMLLFLAIIIPAGAWMSYIAAGNYARLCLVGALDLSIAVALLSSSTVFWQPKRRNS